jgi:ABC-type bacteriocin/lantibiotic exporter with double-glycine peptidase domain
MWKMMSLPLEFFSQRYAGELSARQAANDEVAEVFCSRIVPIAINLFMLILYFSVLLSYNASVALIGAAAGITNIVLILIASGTRKNLTLRLQRDLGQYEGSVASGIDMMETVMACGSEDGFFAKWTGFAGKAANSRIELARKFLFADAAPVFISSLVNAAILCLGVYEILSGRLTVGALVALQALLTVFLTPVSELVESGTAAQSVRGQIERLEDTRKYPSREQYGTDMEPVDSVKIENLTFAYNPTGEPVVNNLSFEVKRGTQTALTGSTGCGKSTVAKLIAGLYEPSGGTISFGGKTRDMIDKDVFYSSVAVVDQEIILFEGSVMDNIVMWDESIDHEDAVQAAKDACIHDEIMTRPGGYSSRVLADGRNFSGGQKQRIEIARALAKNPDILIMDEATNALDAKTEDMVTQAVKNRGITCIIIAHRLSAIRDCDEIIVLERGEITERGVHNELLEAGGLYAGLFSGRCD